MDFNYLQIWYFWKGDNEFRKNLPGVIGFIFWNLSFLVLVHGKFIFS